jgi:phage tail sheath gpL-like
MMSISANYLAAAVGAGVKNVVLKSGSQIVQRKVLVMGTALAAKEAGLVMVTPQLITSPEDAKDRAGAGSAIARAIEAVFRGANYSVPVYAFFQEEPDGAVAATGSIAVTASTPGAGILYLYVAGKLYKIAVATDSTPTTIGSAIVAALAADPDCPVTGVNVTGTVTFTAKSKGLYGNGITIAVNQRPQDGEALPSGVGVTITAMADGAGVPDLEADMAAGLGSGTSANEDFFTDVVHVYGQDTTALSAIADYVGRGNEFVGLYNELVHRPFRSLTGDVRTGSAGLSALIAITDDRLTDRANGVICRPGSLTNPAEIAAEAIGKMAKENNSLAEANYLDLILTGVDPGNVARMAGLDWTQDANNRDIAVKAGISPTIVEGGSVKMQNVVSFYRPANVPVASNAYRSMRNISILQNFLYNFWLTFSSERWKQFTIVKDVMNVTVAASRARARDIDSVKDDLLALIEAFAANAWIYDKEYSINALRSVDAVTVRTGGDGFVNLVPFILSGEGLILDTTALVDTSIAVVA